MQLKFAESQNKSPKGLCKILKAEERNGKIQGKTKDIFINQSVTPPEVWREKFTTHKRGRQRQAERGWRMEAL